MTCLICNYKYLTALLRNKEEEVMFCKACKGLMTQSSSFEINKYYSYKYFKDNYVALSKEQEARISRLCSLLQEYAQGESWLDYGCGTGMLLVAAYNHGFRRIVGVDASDAALQIARTRLPLDVVLVNPQNNPIPCERFQIISLIDSIATLKSPYSTIRDLMQTNLASKGLIIIRTPIIPYWYVIIASYLAKVLPTIISRKLFFLPQRHVQFSEQSIKKFVERMKVKVLHFDLSRDFPTFVLKPKISFKSAKRIFSWFVFKNCTVILQSTH